MSRLNTLPTGRPWNAILAALAATLVAVACGGGGDTVGTGGTGAPLSFSSGRIAGFGSVIVNGVRFDDSTATITDDDDVVHVRGDLKLGMTVDVDAGAISTDTTAGTSSATATAIQFGSQIKGAIESIDTAAGTLHVLGQTVSVDATTVFDGVANGLAGLQPGNLVEIFAFFDSASGTYQATRIELKTTLSEFKLRGLVANLDTTAKTFTIGGATISYAGIASTDLPALANGLLVRVKLQTTALGGVWSATKIRTAAQAIQDHAEAEVEGVVTDFTSLASFKVNGVAVDASGSGVVFHDGTGAEVANGVRIEVEGTMQSGVLVATKVELKQSGDGGHDAEVELHGSLDSVDLANSSFVLRGVTVTFDGNTRFDDGVAANLVVGANVEVEGTLVSGGNTVVATRIKFEH